MIDGSATGCRARAGGAAAMGPKTPRQIDRSDRAAFDRDAVNRALQHDCVLDDRGGDGRPAFAWCRRGRQVGPGFATCELAIEWMVERLNGPEAADLESSPKPSLGGVRPPG